GPGLLAALDRPPDHYLQRRLFPAERIKQGDAPEKTEQLAARSITATQKKNDEKKQAEGGYTLARTGDDWQLTQPYRDLPDPDKLKALLTAVPDVWVELFVEQPDKDLAKYGLDKPEHTLVVSKVNGEPVKLLVGKQSRMK